MEEENNLHSETGNLCSRSQLTPMCSGCHHHLVRLNSKCLVSRATAARGWTLGTARAVPLAFLLWLYLTSTHSCFSWTVLIQDHLLQHLSTWHKSITFWSRLPPPPGLFFQPASPALCISETVPNRLLSSLLSVAYCGRPSVPSLHPRSTTAHLLNSSCHSMLMLFEFNNAKHFIRPFCINGKGLQLPS